MMMQGITNIISKIFKVYEPDELVVVPPTTPIKGGEGLTKCFRRRKRAGPPES